MGWNVWASGGDSLTNVCSDARLRRPNSPRSWGVFGDLQLDLRQSNRAGQGNWRVGVPFTDLADLAARFQRGIVVPESRVGCGSDARIQPRGVDRLAIAVHGSAGGGVTTGGRFFINGLRGTPLTPDNLGQFRAQLTSVFGYTADNAVIFLMGCLAGRGAEGSRLLRTLSSAWPSRTFVAFTTILTGRSSFQNIRGNRCDEAGFRDTGTAMPGAVDTEERIENPRTRMWEHLGDPDYPADYYRLRWDLLQWADENSRHAKVMQNGRFRPGHGDEVDS